MQVYPGIPPPLPVSSPVSCPSPRGAWGGPKSGSRWAGTASPGRCTAPRRGFLRVCRAFLVVASLSFVVFVSSFVLLPPFFFFFERMGLADQIGGDSWLTWRFIHLPGPISSKRTPSAVLHLEGWKDGELCWLAPERERRTLLPFWRFPDFVSKLLPFARNLNLCYLPYCLQGERESVTGNMFIFVFSSRGRKSKWKLFNYTLPVFLGFIHFLERPF